MRFSKERNENLDRVAIFCTPPGRPAGHVSQLPSQPEQAASPALPEGPPRIFSQSVHRIGTGITEADLICGYSGYA